MLSRHIDYELRERDRGVETYAGAGQADEEVADREGDLVCASVAPSLSDSFHTAREELSKDAAEEEQVGT